MSVPRVFPPMPGLVTGRRIPLASDRLHISPAELGAAVAAGAPASSLPAIVLSHALTALRLACGGVRYLVRGPVVGDVYRRMTPSQFACINARQAWANWRTISRNLSGNLPLRRPLSVIDLCCGTGDSTRVLAWWLPPGSRVIGVELDARFAAIASARTYRNRAGEPIPVTVRQASVLSDFRDPAGGRLADGAVDVVHAIGSLGCHFSAEDSGTIVRECARVLASDGLALLDAGPHGTTESELIALGRRHGLAPIGRSRSWWFDRYVQLVMRKSAVAPSAACKTSA